MDNPNRKELLSDFPNAYWLTHPVPSFPPLAEDTEVEVGVIGGGILGILTAYLLAKAGKQVALVEAREFLHGVTGHTTAKISAQHGLIYDDLIRTSDEDTARLYYQANMDGALLIQDIAENLAIDCDLEVKDAAVFATSDKYTQKIEAEARAYEQLGIDGVFAYGLVEDLPFPVESLLTMRNQAQFHPVKFLAPLLLEIKRLGGQIFEHSRAVKLSKNNQVVSMENEAKLTCGKVVVATHYPFNDFDGLYFSKLSVSRSYALAGKITAPLPQRMYLSAESPSRSLRSIRDAQGDDWLLIGGNDHETGKSSVPTQAHYNTLAAFGRTWYGLEDVSYHWSAQDMMTLDEVPYIGQMTAGSADVLMGTGFNKWGMAMGATAARLLADLVLGEENPYTEIFSPLRHKMKTKDVQQFAKKNTAVAKDFVATKMQRPNLTAEELRLDEGGLVSVNGKKAGGYRDADGQLHLVKTTCTHMGCGLRWNDAERSWDCACHGSRFSHTGEVLNGPATKPLEPLEADD